LTRTEVNIAAVADLIKNVQKKTKRMIAESLNIPKTVDLRILKEDLGREDRVTSCQDSIAMANADKNFFEQNYYRR
jgi:hypothetical protein